MDIFSAFFADFLIRFLLILLIFQSLGFFWFVYVVIRFGLLRRDEPDRERAFHAARRHGVSLEEAMRVLDEE